MQALAAASATSVQNSQTVSDNTPAEVVEGGTPIAGPIPLPRHKPRLSLALVHGPLPMPRPRPTEAEAAPQLPPLLQQLQQPTAPAFDRHAVE
jgi:hypothetical protein